MRLKITTLTLSLLSLLLLCLPTWAVMDINSDTPIHISADKMVSHDKEKAVIFTGNVKAKQGDMIINAEIMTIHHQGKKTRDSAGAKPDPPKAGAQIKKIIATGNVEIIQEGFVATGDKVEYLATEEKVILTGHAKIIQDNNMVTGYQVTMNLAEGTTTVTPEKGGKVTTTTPGVTEKPKVEMYFYPKSDKTETE